MVPSKGQFIGETAYFFVRNSIARDNLGHDFRRFLPWLIALFSGEEVATSRRVRRLRVTARAS